MINPEELDMNIYCKWIQHPYRQVQHLNNEHEYQWCEVITHSHNRLRKYGETIDYVIEEVVSLYSGDGRGGVCRPNKCTCMWQ